MHDGIFIAPLSMFQDAARCRGDYAITPPLILILRRFQLVFGTVLPDSAAILRFRHFRHLFSPRSRFHDAISRRRCRHGAAFAAMILKLMMLTPMLRQFSRHAMPPPPD